MNLKQHLTKPTNVKEGNGKDKRCGSEGGWGLMMEGKGLEGKKLGWDGMGWGGVGGCEQNTVYSSGYTPFYGWSAHFIFVSFALEI